MLICMCRLYRGIMLWVMISLYRVKIIASLDEVFR